MTPSTAPASRSSARPCASRRRSALHLVLRRSQLGHAPLDPLQHVVDRRRRASRPPGAGWPRPSRSRVKRVEAGHGLEAAQVRADGPLGHDLDRADVAERPDVGAAAQLGGRPGLRAPARRSPYLSPKKAIAPSSLGLLLRGLEVAHLGVGEHLAGHQVLDLGQLGRRDRLVVGEVEAQPVGRHQRALLADVGAEHRAQGPVQQVGAGVVAADGVAALDVDAGGGLLAGDDLAVEPLDAVADQAGQGVGGVDDGQACPVSVSIVPVSPTWPPASA